MCELFGASFNKQVGIQFAFNKFRESGECNRQGWGFAWYPDKVSSQIIKEAKKATESEISEFISISNTIKSKIFISHVRYATGRGAAAEAVHRNTHPFSKIYKRREYIFAHNGFERPPGAFKRDHSKLLSDFNISQSYFPLGDTDSELAFCHLMDYIRHYSRRNSRRFDNGNDFGILAKKLYLMNECGKLNLMFSDGEYLFCYHTKDQAPNTLKYVRRKAPFGNIKYKDSDQEINLIKTKDSTQKGYIISTNALSNEEWVDFAPGQLIVFKSGEIVYS